MRSRRRVIEPRTAERPECLNNPGLGLQGLGLSFGLDEDQQPIVRPAPPPRPPRALHHALHHALHYAMPAPSLLDHGGEQVSMGVLGLVQALTCSSEAQRFEWARHLLLQATSSASP